MDNTDADSVLSAYAETYAGDIEGLEDSTGPSDGDSGFGDGGSESSNLSTATLFRYENGRRYHAYREGTYTLPNDQKEQDRLDFYHHLWLHLLDGELYTAPLKDPKRVLDIGTGTGIWAIDFADKFPNCEVIGNDLSPVQPVWVPPNCTFEIDDAESPWTHARDSFDYIHLRNLANCFSDWRSVLTQCLAHLAPGAWLEYQDFGYYPLRGHALPQPPPASTAFLDYFHHMHAAAQQLGRPFLRGQQLTQLLQELGFVDITVTSTYWPYSAWPRDAKMREIGRYTHTIIGDVLEAYAMALFTRAGRMSRDGVHDLCARAVAECGRKGGWYYSQIWLIAARKPREGEVVPKHPSPTQDVRYVKWAGRGEGGRAGAQDVEQNVVLPGDRAPPGLRVDPPAAGEAAETETETETEGEEGARPSTATTTTTTTTTATVTAPSVDSDARTTATTSTVRAPSPPPPPPPPSTNTTPAPAPPPATRTPKSARRTPPTPSTSTSASASASASASSSGNASSSSSSSSSSSGGSSAAKRKRPS